MSTSISLTPDERNTLLDYYRAPLDQPERPNSASAPTSSCCSTTATPHPA
jgi:hypothetical protein